MPSAFHRYEDRLSEKADRLMGEPVSIIAHTKSGLMGSKIDETKGIITKTAIVDFDPIVAAPKYAKSRDGFQPSVNGSEVHVSFDLSVFEDEDEQPKSGSDGTKLRLDDPERDGMVLTISRIDPDGIGRIVCVCVKT